MERKNEPLDLKLNIKKFNNALEVPYTINNCCDYFSIFFNMCSLLFLILTIIYGIKKYDGLEGEYFLCICFLICFFGTYLFYLIFQCFSSIKEYIKATDNKIIYQKMEGIYKSNPSIFIEGYSYHYETIYNKEGREFHAKKSTYKGSKKFRPNCCRDISGTFELVINDNCCRTYFLILRLIHEIYFDNNQTLINYNTIKYNFKDNLRNTDTYNSISEYIDTEGITPINILKLQEKAPNIVSYKWYIVFSLLGLGVFYRMYICLISTEKTIVIKKLFSTNNDLMNDKTYDIYNPCFIFRNKKILYTNNNNNFEQKNTIRELPKYENDLQEKNFNNKNTKNMEENNEIKVSIGVVENNDMTEDKITHAKS